MTPNSLNPSQLIEQLQQAPVDFRQVIEVIDSHYNFSPTNFTNGDQFNKANTNNGSCKVLAFGQLHELSEQTTLNAFGQYYAEDVLQNPAGNDHANIRNFMKTGWQGVSFEAFPLTSK